ncbi:iron complex transport system ATP-binding protein [Nocardioides sp. YR527]|uniref:heme ABC transporter ATP-binding protein n=1 Tax=Nocardioides sp. YR527 TaxID=1881028 RepID=UPI00088FD758|nr:heme ABC transporter ATP-binding protein [Nocardioides sp. YR527]SDL04332.1 iron complex transport system ATP-binding protein [Nocardioides sp. YR527]
MLSLSEVSVGLAGHPILHRVSTSVSPGEVVALVGPNGAGKTTLLSVMAGDLAPSAGTVTLDGTPLSAWKQLPLARRRAVLPQEHRLAFGFRAAEVVRMGRAPWARTASEAADDEVVASAMARTDIEPLASRTFPTLSGGEKGRTSFARVLAQTTPLVLLDEPTAALDLRHQDQVLAEARRLASGGSAVVAVLHDLSVAAAYADRIVVLAAGEIVADGPPREVLDADLIGTVYEHPVDVIEHDGRLLVVPSRIHP